jgi:hypothetical protein
LHDNGGSALGGVDTSAPQYFEITIQAPYDIITAPGPGALAGAAPPVRDIHGTTTTQKYNFLAYNPNTEYNGPVRVAVGDVNGDGIADIIVAPGLAGGPLVRVFDGASGAMILQFFAYNPNTEYNGALFVAAGDLFGNGYADIITGTDVGGSPLVRIFDGKSGAMVRQFFTLPSNFFGGVRVATGDVNGDGKADLIIAAGPGGGPAVRVFDGPTGNPMPGALGLFFAYAGNFSGGVYVAAGDINGDGKADIITGPGAGGGPNVRTFDGTTGNMISGSLGNFYAFDPSYTGGVVVASADVDGDGRADLIAAIASGDGPSIRIFSGTTGNQFPSPIGSFFAYDAGFRGGLYIAAGDLNLDGKAEIVTGPGKGGGPVVRAFDVSPIVEKSFTQTPVPTSFLGGVRVAAGDVNFDGIPDTIVATGPGTTPTVRVFDGSSGAPLPGVLGSFNPFSDAPGYTGGVNIAAGDVNKDGYADIVVTPEVGGGPLVRVFDGRTGTLIRQFLAYNPNTEYNGPIRVAVGDINNDGYADIITAPEQGAPLVRVFDGQTGAMIRQFMAFDPSFTGGVNLAAGDVNGDGMADIIAAPASGMAPNVRVFDGASGAMLSGPSGNFMAYSANFTGGVTVAAADVNGDGKADIITGTGAGGGPQVNVFDAATGNIILSYMAYDPSFMGGIFVAGLRSKR